MSEHGELEISRVAEDWFRVDSFYRGKLFEGNKSECDKFIDMQRQAEKAPQPEQPQQQIDDDPDPFGAEGLTAEQKLFNVAQGVLRHTEVTRPALKRDYSGRGQRKAYAGSLDQIALGARHLAEDVTAYLQQRQQSPEQQYEHHLRETAALRYPQEERTAELTMRIEATIRRKVSTFIEERQAQDQARAYEAGLRKELEKRHPRLSADERKAYEDRIRELVREFRQNQTQRQQQQDQTPPAQVRQQEQGIER